MANSPLDNPLPKLTNKQELFCKEYLIDLNATQAAIRAGYSKKSVRSQSQGLMANPSIQARIQFAMTERVKRTEVTSDYVLKAITDTIDRCSQRTFPVDANGERVMVMTDSGLVPAEHPFDATAVLRGSELLGKHLRLFTEKVEVETTVNGHTMTDQDVSEAARRIAFSLTKQTNNQPITPKVH